MTKSNRDLLAGLVALAVAAASVYFAVVGRSPKVNLDTYQVLGEIAAQETAKLLNGKGRVLVLARGTGDAANPSVEAELKAFQQYLAKHSAVSSSVEKVQASAVEMMATGGGLPAEALFKALETHAGLGALVLFLGFPPLNDSEIEALGRYKVKIVVVTAFQPGLDRLLERQIVDLALLPKPDAGTETPHPARTVRERFDQEYTILTPARGSSPP